MNQYALDAVTLVPRERVCDHNRDPAHADRKILDVDVYIAGQHRGTWCRKFDDDRYDLRLEVFDFSGAVTWSQNLGVGLTKLDALKATTADLLVAGKLPTRRDYFEKRAMVFFVDYWKIAAVAVVAIGLGYWLLR